jgi:hypothetical protein
VKAPVYLPPALYDAAKARGYDMTGYAVTPPIRKTEPQPTYKRVFTR